MGCIDRTLLKPIGINWDAEKFIEIKWNPEKSNGMHSNSLKSLKCIEIKLDLQKFNGMN